jgi:hypothetical protein
MSLPVSLNAVADEIEILNEQSVAYINRRTGELFRLSDEEIALAEDEDPEGGDLPEWQADMIPKIREILDSDEWVELPTSFDVHEWEIMRRFGDAIGNPDAAQQISRAIHGGGAFRAFRATVERLGLRDQWFEFKRRAVLEIARDALEDLDIPYTEP